MKNRMIYECEFCHKNHPAVEIRDQKTGKMRLAAVDCPQYSTPPKPENFKVDPGLPHIPSLINSKE